MGEIRNWWASLTPFRKIGYPLFGVLIFATFSLNMYNNKRYIYDKEKSKAKKLSKWDQ